MVYLIGVGRYILVEDFLVDGSVFTSTVIVNGLGSFHDVFSSARLETESHRAARPLHARLVSDSRTQATLLYISREFRNGAVADGTVESRLLSILLFLQQVLQLILLDEQLVNQVVNLSMILGDTQIVRDVDEEVPVDKVFNQVSVEVRQLVREEAPLALGHLLTELAAAVALIHKLLLHLLFQVDLKSLLCLLLAMLTDNSHVNVRSHLLGFLED